MKPRIQLPHARKPARLLTWTMVACSPRFLRQLRGAIHSARWLCREQPVEADLHAFEQALADPRHNQDLLEFLRVALAWPRLLLVWRERQHYKHRLRRHLLKKEARAQNKAQRNQYKQGSGSSASTRPPAQKGSSTTGPAQCRLCPQSLRKRLWQLRWLRCRMAAQGLPAQGPPAPVREEPAPAREDMHPTLRRSWATSLLATGTATSPIEL